MTVGEMYFDKAKLKINMDNVGRVGKDGQKKLLGLVIVSSKIMIIITNKFIGISLNYLMQYLYDIGITGMKKYEQWEKERLEMQCYIDEKMIK